MRRLILGCLVFGGCLVKDNPAWEGGDEASAGGSSGTSGVSGAASSTGGSGAVPTTGAGEGTGGATDSQGEPTTGAVAATTTTTSGDSTGEASSTGEGSSTGQPVAHCEASELVKVDLDKESRADAGVVPSSMGKPCPWGDGMEMDCGPLNFGKTEFFRLVHDMALGQSAALIRFDAGKVVEFIADGGYAAKDLIGARLELVVWEPLAQPAQDSTLEIGMLVGDEAWWDEGGRDAKKAMEKESSANCRTIESGACKPWPKVDALTSSTSIGLLLVTPAIAAAADQDNLPDQYHAKLRSEPLGPQLIEAFAEGKAPSLVVSLSSMRGLGEGPIGVKLEESPWDDPTLYLEVCTMWSR